MRLVIALVIFALIGVVCRINARYSNPVVDERERMMRLRVSAAVSSAIEVTMVLLILITLAGVRFSGLTVLVTIGVVANLAQVISNVMLRAEDMEPTE